MEFKAIYDTLARQRAIGIEIIEGRLIVTPGPVRSQYAVIAWLLAAFRDVACARGWQPIPVACVDIPLTEEQFEPDFTILRSPDVAWLGSVIAPEDVLLVSEVVSTFSVRDDREVKPRSCALAGIPFYLLVDRLSAPPTLTLFSDPGEETYECTTAIAVGESLELPAPFGFALDTGSLP